MKIKSIWNHYAGTTNFSRVESDLTVDVAILGGGITGISCAQVLSEAGLRVAVLEARKVGGGTTAHSTGNLYVTTDKNLLKLRKKHDMETISALTSGRNEAINWMEKNVKHLSIDCDFKRLPWFLYSTREETVSKITDEYEIGREMGLPFSYSAIQTPYAIKKMLTLPEQAQVNPLLYVQGLAEKIASPACKIFENSEVHTIEEKDGDQQLKLSHGPKVRAKYLIHATHIPKGVMSVQTLMGPYREYGIGCKVRNPERLPEGIFWGYHEQEDFVSTRRYHRGGDTYIVAVGQPHKVGQKSSNEENIGHLRQFVKEQYDLEEVSFTWGGQHYRPADFLPYIGREHKNSNVFIATGLSTDGLVFGTLAAFLIRDIITKKENKLVEILKPDRKDILKAAPNFLKENLNVTAQYLKDLPGITNHKPIEEVKKGEGRVIEQHGQKLAVFRQENGELSVCSAVCTHMECIVNWNHSEKSWDCPCHGSRFEATGSLIEGPALHGLHTVMLEGEQNG